MKQFQLNASVLKWIAIITMFIDHFGAVVIYHGFYHEQAGIIAVKLLTPEMQKTMHDLYYVMRGIGRLAFPIFCFFIVEGFLKTRNLRKYVIRLLIFGIVSEIPFDLGIGGKWFFPEHQNVMFTMAIGLMTLYGIRYFWDGDLDTLTMRGALGTLFSIICGSGFAWLLKTDYGYKGVLLIVVLYLFRERRDAQCLAGAAAIAWENWAPLSFIPLYFYNGQRGRQNKYVFYVFYPAHLLMLYGIVHWGIPWYFGN